MTRPTDSHMPPRLRVRRSCAFACSFFGARTRATIGIALPNRWVLRVTLVAFLAGFLVVLPTGVRAQPSRSLQRADRVSSVEYANITSVRELRDGSVLVADSHDNRLVLDSWADGAPIALSRLGGGPGEYRRIGVVHALADDSTLLTDSFTGRWLLLDGSRVVATVSEANATNRDFIEGISGADNSGRVLGAFGNRLLETGGRYQRAGVGSPCCPDAAAARRASWRPTHS